MESKMNPTPRSIFELKVEGLWFNQLTTAKLVVSSNRDYPLELVIDDLAPVTAPVVLS